MSQIEYFLYMDYDQILNLADKHNTRINDPQNLKQFKMLHDSDCFILQTQTMG